MATTTKAKCEFYFHMARHTRATPGQVQRLLRYAATLQRLAVDECNNGLSPGMEDKRLRIANKVLAVCNEIGPEREGKSLTVPVFSGDPRGAVLKIRVPDGFTDDLGREGICVPA